MLAVKVQSCGTSQHEIDKNVNRFFSYGAKTKTKLTLYNLFWKSHFQNMVCIRLSFNKLTTRCYGAKYYMQPYNQRHYIAWILFMLLSLLFNISILCAVYQHHIGHTIHHIKMPFLSYVPYIIEYNGWSNYWDFEIGLVI